MLNLSLEHTSLDSRVPTQMKFLTEQGEKIIKRAGSLANSNLKKNYFLTRGNVALITYFHFKQQLPDLKTQNPQVLSNTQKMLKKTTTCKTLK